MNKLGNNIRCLRMAYGETQEQLGFAIDVAKNTISSYEKGRTEPDKNILSLLSVHFMVSVEELLISGFLEQEKPESSLSSAGSPASSSVPNDKYSRMLILMYLSFICIRFFPHFHKCP